MGTKKFLVMTLFLLVASGLIFVFLSWLLFVTNLYPDTYFGYTIGFSCVLFGYKVVSHYYHVNPPSMFGLPASSSLVSWLELFYMSLFPNVSFLGHLSGMLAGYLYIFLPKWMKRISDVDLRSFASFEGIHRPEPSKPAMYEEEFTDEDIDELNRELRHREEEDEIRRRRIEHIEQSRRF